jgi:2-methylaconitate cis-trans-isomerase PrpF
VSIVDAGNPAVFVRPSAFGLMGTELPDAFTPGLLAQMEAVRAAAAKRLGLMDEAMRAIPKLYLIRSPIDYTDLTGRPVCADHVNLVGRGLSMGVPHHAYAATVAICTAAAALLPGTLVQAALRPDLVRPAHIRIGHPPGFSASTRRWNGSRVMQGLSERQWSEPPDASWRGPCMFRWSRLMTRMRYMEHQLRHPGRWL